MDIFLTKTHWFATGGLYSPPGAMWGSFYLWWECFIWHLVDCSTETPADYNDNAWNNQDNFYTIPTVFAEGRRSYTHGMPRGWVKHRLIFVFEWTNPLNAGYFIWLKVSLLARYSVPLRYCRPSKKERHCNIIKESPTRRQLLWNIWHAIYLYLSAIQNPVVWN